MANKPKFLKNLLTTASVFSVLAIGASDALAVDGQTNGNVTVAIPVNNANWAAATSVTTGGTIIIGNNGDAITIDPSFAGNAIAAVRVGNNLGGITTNASFSLGSVAGAGNAGNLTYNANNVNVTLTGTAGTGNNPPVNDYSKLANIDFNGQNAAVLTTTGGAYTLTGNFANGGNDTILNVQNDLTSKNNAGNTALAVKNVNIAAGGTLRIDATGAAVAVGGVVNLAANNSTLELKSANGGGAVTYTLNGGSVTAAGDGVNGTLTLTVAGQNMTIAKNAAEAIGAAGNRLKEMNINANAKNVTVNPNLFAKQINVDTNNNKVIFGGAINTGADGGMKITTAANNIQINANSTIGTLDFNNAASVVKVANGIKLTSNLVGNAANNAHTNGTLFFVQGGELEGTATRLNAIRADGAGVVKLAGEHIVTDIQGDDNGGTLELADGFKVTGGINVAGGLSNVKVQFKGAGEVTGTIGAGTAVGDIEIYGGADKLVKIGGNVTTNGANSIAFKADGMLVATQDAALTIDSAITLAADNNGTIDADAITGGKLLKIDGAIGAVAGNALKLISATGGANIELDGGDVHVKKIDIGNSDVDVKLSKNAGDYKIVEFAHASGSGRLVINEDVTLKGGTVISKADNKLKAVHFTGDHDLTVEDGIDLYTVNGITNTGDGNGKLILNGAHIISGNVGAENTRVGNITIVAGAADKVTKFLNDVNSKGTILLNDANAAVQFAGNVNAAHIKGGAPNQGTVEFTNANDAGIKVDAEIGNTNAVKLVKISGGRVEITKNVTSQDGFEFGANSTGFLTLDLDDLGASKVVVGRTDAVNKIIVKNNQDILPAAQIGTQANRLGAIVLDDAAAKSIKVQTANFFSGIEFAQDQKHNVEIANDTVKMSGIGAADKRADAVTFSAGTTAEVGGVFAKSVVINDGKVITFNGIDTINGLTLGHTAAGNAVANFTDGAVVNSKIDTAAVAAGANAGKVNFAGGVFIEQAIGGTTDLKEVNFNGNNGKEVLLGANISAADIKMQKDNFSVNSNVTLNGKITATNSTVALNSNTLSVTGNDASAFTGDVTLITTFDGKAYGSINVTDNKLSFGNVNSLGVKIEDGAVTALPGADGFTINLVTKQGNGDFTFAPDAKVSLVPNQNPFIKWAHVSGSATFKATNNAVQAITTVISNAKSSILSTEDAQVFGHLNNSGDMLTTELEISKLVQSGQEAKAVQLMEKLVMIESAAAVSVQAVSSVNSTLAARVADVTTPNVVGQVDTAEAAGVAAGDNDAYSYGAWATPFYSHATQKQKLKTPGYKAKTAGLTVGFDTRANDTMTVGVALSLVNDNVKFKAPAAGDKTKVNTYMFSVYGMQQVTDNWFLQGTASFGNSNVKNTALRITSTTNQTATGKYDSMTYGGQLLAGYHFPMSDAALVTPMGGLKYNRFNDTGYKETGTTSQNRTISKKSVDKIEGVLGVRATFFTEMNGMNIVPGVHGFVNYDFRGKAPHVTARLDGQAVDFASTRVAKPEKALYNVGLNVKAMNGTMEYGAGYDAFFTKKYTAHQGSLKVRVNF